MAQIFTVTAEQKAFKCLANIRLRKVGALEESEMACVVTLPLGVPKNSRTVKDLRPIFEKALNSMAEKRSARFLKQLSEESKILARMLETDEELRRAVVDGKRNFVNDKNKEIQDLWENWSTRLAPRWAADVLEECLKKSKDADAKSLAATNAKATGKVSQMPNFAIAAGFSSALAAALTASSGPVGVGLGIAGVVTGIAKMLSGYLKLSKDTQDALASVQRDQAGLVKDVEAVYLAVVQVNTRLGELDTHRGVLERQIISITQGNRKLRDEIAKLSDSAGGERSKEIDSLRKAFAANEDALKSVRAEIVETAELRASLDAMYEPVKRLLRQSKEGYKSSNKAESRFRTVLDGSRESLTVAANLAKFFK